MKSRNLHKPLHILAALVMLTSLVFHTIVFADDWDVTKARGDKLRQIAFTTTEGTWMSVDISPDGLWIAFDMLGHIYRVRAEGGTAECLTQNSGIALNFHPRYSPDGTEIAFISDRGGQDNLWIMQADGSEPRRIFQDLSARAVEPAWMPDGKNILVTKRLMTSFGFYRMDDAIWLYARDGSGGHEIIGRGDAPPSPQKFSGNPRYQWPAASHDGKLVYFNAAAFDGDNRQIKRIELESGRVEDVTETKLIYPSCCGRPADPDLLGEAGPELSPDGQWLTFARKIPGGLTQYRDKEYVGRTALWLRNLRTGEEHILMDPIEMDAMDGHPSWKLRVLPGYSWAHDSRSIVISQGGKIRRVWIENGKVQTIPIVVHVERTISEQARGHVAFDDKSFEAHAIRWPAASPDGFQLAFEAVGRIWIKDLPDGKPRPLTDGANSDIDVERTPTWSPDGRAIVYVSAGKDGLGQLWRVELKNGKKTQLTKEAGTYAYPLFTDNGRTVVVSRWPPELTPMLRSNSWELISMPEMGGKTSFLVRTGQLVKANSSIGNQIYYVKSSADLARSIITSLDASDGGSIEHLAIVGPVTSMSVSPDGRMLAFERSRDLYLVALNKPQPSETPPLVDVTAKSNPLPVKRVSHGGGFFPHWLDNNRLAYLVGSRYVTYNIANGESKLATIGLRVQREASHGTIALTDARIITVVGNQVIDKGTILVKDARIACVGVCDTSKADREIDLSGKTIMPGWVDTHAHHQSSDPYGFIPKQRGDSAVYLAYGVTTTFDPFTPDHAFSIDEMTAAGTILGPRSFSAGLALTCGWDPRIYASGLKFGGIVDDIPNIETYQDAENLVREYVEMGAISIKDYKQCTRTQREMLASAARKLGVSITTENGDFLYILGQIMNGYPGWEHPMEYKPIYKDVVTFIGQSKSHYSADLILSDYPQGDAIEYWFGQNDLWQDEKVTRWLPWQKIAVRRIFFKKPEREYSFPILAEGAWEMAQAGAYPTIGAHGEQDGLGNHWEAQIMALAAPPYEVLRYATYNGAHFLGLENDIGSLEVGKLADLVVLNSNPLEDIHNTLDNCFVMVNGKLYDTDTLDEIWPTERTYGPRPWVNEEIRRRDLRPVNYWDQDPGGEQIR